MVMPYQQLIDAARGRARIIKAAHFRDDQFQPATIDLRLGNKIDAISAWFMPGLHDSIEDRIRELSQYSFDLLPNKTHHLDRKKIYIVPLMEECEFPDNKRMFISPKSSVGRNDVFVQVIAEKYRRNNRTPWGYKGKLWAQIVSESFNVGVRAGLPLVQGRIKTRDSHTLTTDEVYHLHEKCGVACGKDGKPLSGHDALRVEEGRMEFHIDLSRDIVGFRAKRQVHTQLDLSANPNTYDPKEFWERLQRPLDGRLVLDPNEFYLLATLERVSIPPECCGELVPVDPGLGEFRVHYAGFFDNGFGGRHGTHGVLEVRASQVPFILEHGQPVCAMVFERTFEVPQKLYGAAGSSYSDDPEPSLAKHFAHRYDSWRHGPFWPLN